MADCSKTVEFMRELNRMHEAFDECRNCPLSGWKREPSGPGCIEFIKHHTEQTIAIVQKWSDEHPAQTWEGKLRELLPNMNIKNVVEYLCPHELFGSAAPTPSEDCTVPCADCWNSEYKEGPTNGDQQQSQG